VPLQPNAVRFASVSAMFTSIPSAAHTIIPASSTADGSSAGGSTASSPADGIASPAFSSFECC